MVYKFLTVLSIFSASITFAVDLPKTGEKRELENIFNDEQSTKKMAIFLLHKACEEGDIEKVKELLMTENINQKDGNGNTPILAACAYGQAEVVELLLAEDYIKYININAINKQGNSLLHLACKKFKGEDAKIIKKITEHQHICINYRDGENNSAFMIACVNDNLAAIKLLLEHPEIIVNYVDEKYPHTPLHFACINNKKEIVKELLKYSKTDPNVKYKFTPLHIVCKNGNAKMVKLLLKSDKININERDIDTFDTALDIAVKASKPNIVKLLLKEKEINIDNTVFEPLFNTIENNKEVNGDTELIIKYFIKYTYEQISEQISSEDIKMLFDTCMKHKKTNLVSLILDQLDQDDFDINVEGLFLSACSNNDKNTSEMLIKKYDINNSDLYNRGLIRVSDSESTDRTELAKLLISHNANVNYLDDKNISPLHHACERGNLELVKLLVDNNADLNLLLNEEWPLDLALCSFCMACQKRDCELQKKLEDLIEYLLLNKALYSKRFDDTCYAGHVLDKIKSKSANGAVGEVCFFWLKKPQAN